MATDYSSFDIDFSSKTESLALITARFGSTPSDATVLLELSTGTDVDSQTVYRPYYVLGEILGLDINFQKYKSLRSAAGSSVEYNSPYDAKVQMWAMQNRLDERFGLTVADGFEAGTGAFEAEF